MHWWGTAAAIYTILLFGLLIQSIHFYGAYSYGALKGADAVKMAAATTDAAIMQKHLTNALEYLKPYNGATGLYPTDNTNFDYYKQSIQAELGRLYALPQDSIQQQQNVQNIQNALAAGGVTLAAGINHAQWNYGSNPYTNPVGFGLLFLVFLAWIPMWIGFSAVEHVQRSNRRKQYQTV